MDASLPELCDLAHLYVLDSLKGFGPQKFKQLYLSKISASQVVSDPSLLSAFGKRGETIRKQLETERGKLVADCKRRAEKQLDIAARLNAHIITYTHPDYPKTVFESNNPIPVLYARGAKQLLRALRTVACVGSRNIRPPYTNWHALFAKSAVADGYTIVSGFALGADTIGHKTAIDCGGSTICVMPSGLDRPFPPENKSLWQRFLEEPSVAFVSEFAFGTGAASLNLRKRNKSIVAFSEGVLVSQSSRSGGAMNAYRFAIEQKKPIATFQHDSSEETSGNQQIETDKPSVPVTVFSGPDAEAFKRWLQALSFLI